MKTEVLTSHNPWWAEGRVPEDLPKPYRRKVFSSLAKWLEGDRVVGLIGPRRSGKTTLLYQLIAYLISEKHIAPRRIIYVSADDPMFSEFDFEELLEYYQQYVIEKELGKETIYFFIDEVQFIDNWAKWVKRYYDLKSPVKFIVSGSSATYIKKKSKESLVGRIVEEEISSFSFQEFLECDKGIEAKLSLKKLLNGDFSDIMRLKASGKEKKIKSALLEYMKRGGFPEYFPETEFLIWSKLIKSDIVDKTLFKDLVEVYDIKMPSLLEDMLAYLAGISSSILSHSKLADILGLSRLSVANYLSYLKSAFLVEESQNYSGSAAKRARSLKKVYLTDAGLMNALLNEEHITDSNKGRICETVAFNHAKRLSPEIHYWRDYYEVDIVLKVGKLVLPVEVKYQKSTAKGDLLPLKKFSEKYKAKNAILVTKDTLDRKGNIILLPLWAFLLTETES